ncbi:MAG: mechanosensitive ion channel [Woeseiaceae bacterium]|nr:mechanosensitive ion channel [Woeseiaceae bacterium]
MVNKVESVTQAVGGLDTGKLLEMLQTTGVEFAINLVTAALIFFIGKWVVGLVVKAIANMMQKGSIDSTLERFICSLVRISLMVVVIIAAIGQLGVQTTSLLAVMGAAGLAVGLALQGSLSNFAAGVLIVLFRPYKVGDYVEAAGVAGSIEEVQILTTVMKTPDNKRIIVPNSQIMSSIITNYSANDTRRVDLTFGVSYSDDLDQVHKELRALVDADDRILKDPEVTIKVQALADSSVNFIVRPWVNSGDYWGVYFDLTEKVKKRFDEVGISFPFPQQDVHLHKAYDD